jgi:hypothetical protein
MAGYSNTYSGDLTTTIASKLYSAVKKRIEKNRDKADEEQDKLKESVKEAERAVDPKATKVTDKANRQYVAKVFGVGIDLKLMQMEASAEKSLEQINEIKALTAHNTSLIIDHNEMLINKLDALLGVFQEKLALDKKLADDAETARATGGGGGSGTKGYLKNLLNRPGNFIANFIKDLLLRRAKTALQRIVPRRLRARGRLLSRQLGRRVGPAARAMLRPRAAARTALTNYAKQGTKTLGIKLGAKGAAKAGLKTVGKKLPFGIGLGISAIFAAQRLFQKPPDPMGAALELASGAAAFVPGIGTAASLAIDAGLAARDMKKESETQQYATGTQNQYTKKGLAILHGKESVDRVDPKSGLSIAAIESLGSKILSISYATARAGNVDGAILSEVSRLPFKIYNVPVKADVKPRAVKASNAFDFSRRLTQTFNTTQYGNLPEEEEPDPNAPNAPNAPPRQQNPLQRLFGGGGSRQRPRLTPQIGTQSHIWNKNLPETAVTFDAAQGIDKSGEPGVDFSFNNIYKNYAVFSGEVIDVGPVPGSPAYGESVTIRSTDPFDPSRQFDSLYAHFSPGTPVVQKGQSISVGDYLGPVGWIGPWYSGTPAPGAGNMGGPHTSLDFYEPDSVAPAKNFRQLQRYVLNLEGKSPPSTPSASQPQGPQGKGYGKGGLGGAQNYFKRGTGGSKQGRGTKVSDKDFAALVAISSLEAGVPQARVDVAQSIMNRLGDGTYGSTLFSVITANGQYQPAYINPNASQGPLTKTSPEWKAVKDKPSAIEAMRSYYWRRYQKRVSYAEMQELYESTLAAMKNPAMQAAAARKIGGRTEFLGYKVEGADVVMREGYGNNSFFAAYGSGNQLSRGAMPFPQRVIPKPRPPKPSTTPTPQPAPAPGENQWWDLLDLFPNQSNLPQRLMASSADVESIEEELNLLPVVLNKTVFVTKPSMNSGGMVATRQPTGYTRENYQMSRLAT